MDILNDLIYLESGILDIVYIRADLVQVQVQREDFFNVCTETIKKKTPQNRATHLLIPILCLDLLSVKILIIIKVHFYSAFSYAQSALQYSIETLVTYNHMI